MGWLSCGFEADSVDEGIEVIDDALVEAVELRSPLVMEASIRAYGAEKAGGKRRINAFEELQEDEADRVSVREELVAARAWQLGDEAFGAQL